jgi:hypothetical protein
MSDSPESPQEGDLLLYQTAWTIRIEGVDPGETFWLNQKWIATRFQWLSTVSGDLAAFDHPGKLSHAATVHKSRRVGPEENRRRLSHHKGRPSKPEGTA